MSEKMIVTFRIIYSPCIGPVSQFSDVRKEDEWACLRSLCVFLLPEVNIFLFVKIQRHHDHIQDK